MPGTVRRVKQTITQLIDDIDGGKAEETVLFAIDGTNYEIDLSRRNAARLRDLLNGYTPYARAVRGGVQQRRRRRRRAAPTTTTIHSSRWTTGRYGPGRHRTGSSSVPAGAFRLA